MAHKKQIRGPRSSKANEDFQISNGPVVHTTATARGDANALPKLFRVCDVPRLFAIARDPQTIFAYWNINWPAVFGEAVPEDRQVHVRVLRRDGAEETAVAAEPMAGNVCINVSPTGPYRLDLGYYGAAKQWTSLVTSDEVVMPAGSIAEDAEVDLATIPFHLSFQRLIDLFQLTNREALATTIGRLEARIASEDDAAPLSDEERQLLEQMNISLGELRAAWHSFELAKKAGALRKRAEAILGLGGSSLARPFGGGS
jgi:hypothetical protein